jgi:hypothetical protein
LRAGLSRSSSPPPVVGGFSRRSGRDRPPRLAQVQRSRPGPGLRYPRFAELIDRRLRLEFPLRPASIRTLDEPRSRLGALWGPKRQALPSR